MGHALGSNNSEVVKRNLWLFWFFIPVVKCGILSDQTCNTLLILM
jgi:hypothetical protein